jgi:beta-lactamase regulating signal transducer with metallopeptidase domain
MDRGASVNGMGACLEALLSNALVATLLAALAAAVGLARPRPAVMHALWLIVLVKFVTPQLVRVDVLPGLALLREMLQATANAPSVVANVSPPDEPDRSITTIDDADEGLTWPRRAAVQEEAEFSNGALPSPAVAGHSEAPSLVRMPAKAHPSAGGRFANLQAALSAIWLAGSAGWFVVAGVRMVRFHRELRRTRPAGDGLQATANQVARRLGLRCRPSVRITDAAVPPMLAALFGRGVVVLPRALLRDLSPQQRSAIVAHELAHFRRGDQWTRWLEFGVLGVYWWHPVAWFARRQLQQAEELCCDAWVLRVFPDQAKGYAQALLATVDFLSEVRMPAPAGASSFGHVQSLQRRLEMILKRTYRPDLSSAARYALIALALGVLPWTPRALAQTKPGEPAADVPKTPKPGNLQNELLPATDKPAAQKPSTEERLDRLEAMLEQLLAATKAGRLALPAVPATPQASPAAGDEHARAELMARVKDLSAKIDATESQLRKLQDEREMLLKKLGIATSDIGLPAGETGEGNHLFVKDGHLWATEPKTGKAVWSLRLDEHQGAKKVISADGKVIVVDEGGKRVFLDSRTGKTIRVMEGGDAKGELPAQP